MKKTMQILAAAISVLYVIALFVPIDPDERRPGTRLSGELAEQQQTDWDFLSGRTKILVETQTWYFIPHSVTTTSMVRDGNFYVPCGSCAGKRWPKNVVADPQVRIKVAGKLYERTAVLITDSDQRRRLLNIPDDEVLSDTLAVYRMDVRSKE